VRRLAHAVRPQTARQQVLRREDIPRLAGAIGAGGIAGPILLMTGLARTDASASSLLLTLEGAATALMGWFIFHENFDRRLALGRILAICSFGRWFLHAGQHLHVGNADGHAADPARAMLSGIALDA